MPGQTLKMLKIVSEMTANGASAGEIAQHIARSERTVHLYRAAAKTPGTPGRRQVTGQIAEEVLKLAREGVQRKLIAKQLELAESTVKRITLAAGFNFPRGGDRRSEEARAARREAPAGLFDKRIDRITAGRWAGSAYEKQRLKSEHREQKELPRTLKLKAFF